MDIFKYTGEFVYKSDRPIFKQILDNCSNVILESDSNEIIKILRQEKLMYTVMMFSASINDFNSLDQSFKDYANEIYQKGIDNGFGWEDDLSYLF